MSAERLAEIRERRATSITSWATVAQPDGSTPMVPPDALWTIATTVGDVDYLLAEVERLAQVEAERDAAVQRAHAAEARYQGSQRMMREIMDEMCQVCDILGGPDSQRPAVDLASAVKVERDGMLGFFTMLDEEIPGIASEVAKWRADRASPEVWGELVSRFADWASSDESSRQDEAVDEMRERAEAAENERDELRHLVDTECPIGALDLAHTWQVEKAHLMDEVAELRAQLVAAGEGEILLRIGAEAQMARARRKYLVGIDTLSDVAKAHYDGQVRAYEWLLEQLAASPSEGEDIST